MSRTFTTALIVLIICEGLVSPFVNVHSSNQTKPKISKPTTQPRASTQNRDATKTSRNPIALPEFENYVRSEMERDRIPGMTIGCLKDDFTWVKAFGYADVENKVPAREDSAYRIASTTKTYLNAR